MNRTDEFADIKIIADAIADETATGEQIAQLDELLKGNKAAQSFYFQYLNMHIQLHSYEPPAIEVVRRSLKLEEFIVRPAGSASSSFPPFTPPQIEPVTVPTLPAKYIFITSLPIFISIILFIFFFWTESKAGVLGELVNCELRINGLGEIDGNDFYPGSYYADQACHLMMKTGEQITLAESSYVKFYNNTEMELRQGQLTITQGAGHNIIISGPHFKLHSGGDRLSVNLSADMPQVIAGSKTLLYPERWRPKHFWSFDGNSDRALDYAGDAAGIVSAGAKRVVGLVGAGAFKFDNTKDARINVGSGGGTAPATGSFSVSDGVSIEALVVPYFSGKIAEGETYGELDEIFRKDQDDKDHRILLSFQRDKGKNNLMPEGDYAETLSFGLYLVGQGYHELKLPLDGKNNRPTLAQLKDGRPHHVVATYDVKTGLKAIYVDGVMHAHYQYPPGSKMLSGGSGMANIGNSPNALNHDKEAFSGIIDEMAFYDFALTAPVIHQHFIFSQQGKNYFGLTPNGKLLPKTVNIQLTNQWSYTLDPLTGLPSMQKGTE